MDNPFALAGAPGPALAPAPDAEAQAQLLDGFVEIEARYWRNLPRGRAVRCLRQGGRLAAGFVEENRLGAVGEPFLRLRGRWKRDDPEQSFWRLGRAEIRKVYLRPPPSIMMYLSHLEEAVRTQNKNLRKVVAFLKRGPVRPGGPAASS